MATNKEKKEKFKENPSTPPEQWAWNREMIEILLEENMELTRRVEKLEKQVNG